MMSYTNGSAIQYLRQYEMFANSLGLVNSREQKNMIIKQLNKLEEKIIDQTNENYEEEYYTLANTECDLLDDEKKRVSMLIDLINQRLSYVEKRCNDHYQLTGESIEIKDVLGANTLDILENRIKVIDKYKKNTKLEKELKNEVESLSNKISLASEKMDINRSLNSELEIKFKNILSNAFEKLNLYSLLDNKDEIENNYLEVEETLKAAELNYEIAKTSPVNILSDCKDMLDDIKKDYDGYREKISLLKLMEIFNVSVETYEELLEKRKEVNELFKYIKNEEFNNLVYNEIDKQYNTITMEQQDINTYDDLVNEKERKLDALEEITEENNSEEFQSVLNVLIENEKKKEKKLLEEKMRIEEEEKKRRLAIERKRQEEILKRQKLIEDARKKEMEERTKQLLEQQQNSVLQKKKDYGVSFENIKSISDSDDEYVPEETNDAPLEVLNKEEDKDRVNFKLELNKIVDDSSLEDIDYKNKDEIENELFEEFNANKQLKEVYDNDDDVQSVNKLPEVSLDEYMKNFDEKSIEPSSGLNFFDDDEFPSIPL